RIAAPSNVDGQPAGPIRFHHTPAADFGRPLPARLRIPQTSYHRALIDDRRPPTLRITPPNGKVGSQVSPCLPCQAPQCRSKLNVGESLPSFRRSVQFPDFEFGLATDRRQESCMTLFAKILTIVNVLAAIAFLVIAGKDYGIRQSWARAVFLHEIAIHGLPVAHNDDSWRPGTPTAKDLSPGLLKDIYGSAPGEQFRTQQQELERVKDDILGIVDSAPNDNAKRMKLAGYLLPLMQSGEERDRFLGFLQQRSRTPIQDLRDALVFRLDS